MCENMEKKKSFLRVSVISHDVKFLPGSKPLSSISPLVCWFCLGSTHSPSSASKSNCSSPSSVLLVFSWGTWFCNENETFKIFYCLLLAMKIINAIAKVYSEVQDHFILPPSIYYKN